VAGAGYVVICLGFGLAGGVIGRMKGSSFIVWFLIAGLVPFFGLLAAICYRWENRELRRRCPECGRIIKLHDTLCRCGADLEYPEVAIAPEVVTRRPAA
jgi:hypothetical protein